MEVMCINDSGFTIILRHPKCGEIVDVIDSIEHKESYIVSGYEIDIDGSRCYFKKHRFVPLSDIDEKELVKERELLNAQYEE